jgi:endoglucanase
MIERLNTLFVTVVCILVLPAVALAQFPSPCYGWNLGNTMEPPDGEGTWNNPPATQAMINAVADAGFNTIRIPVAWDSHADESTHVIDATWLDRVKTVVDWSLDAGLTVVINDHWDGGWLENNIGDTVDAGIDAKMSAYWTQIANTFAGANYDERLLFAGTNEPNVDSPAEMATLLHYEQTFVDAVREVGGSNTSRWLVVQGPWTHIDLTDSLMNTLPTDSTPGRLAVEVHQYNPWEYCGAAAADARFFWGEDYHSTTMPDRNVTWGEEDWQLGQLQKMYDKFVSRGVPVILGEFGAMNRTGYPDLTGADLDLYLASRLYFHQLIVDTANSLGIAPFYWDNGWTSEDGQNGFGIFDRDTATVFDQDMVDALTGGPELPGDYNADGVVDAADYTVWRDHLGERIGLHNDPTPGTVGPEDYDVWKAHFGQVSAAGSGTLATAAAVPEPATVVLWLAAAALAVIRRRVSCVGWDDAGADVGRPRSGQTP